MTRDEAIGLARKHAKNKPQSYYGEPFHPHEWVIDAIIEAHQKGKDEEFENPSRNYED